MWPRPPHEDEHVEEANDVSLQPRYQPVRRHPNMKPERLELLMKAFDASVRGHAIFREIVGVI
jgi:hypothetical protein